MEVFWFLRSKAVLIILQDGFENFDANNTGGCLGVVISAPLDFFDDVVRLALGFCGMLADSSWIRIFMQHR